MRFARNCEIALARFIPMTPLSKTMNLTLVGKGKERLNHLGRIMALGSIPNIHGFFATTCT